MNGMFYEASEFNGDVSDWDVSSVTDMNSMFDEATEFNGDVSDWDVSSVTDMKWMFYKATKFNGDVSDWDVLARPFCIGVRNQFNSYGVDCNFYDSNNCHADIDDTTNYYANDVCSECGECFDPLIANTSPPTVSSPPTITLSSSPTLSPTVSSPPTPTTPPCIGVRNKFTTSDGNNCSLYDATYYERDDYFRDDDFDSFAMICFNHTDPFTNYYAKDVCSECGECVDPLIANTSPPTLSSSPTVSSSPTPTSPPTPTRPLCIGVRNQYISSIYGEDCSQYFGCSVQGCLCKFDFDGTTYHDAKDVCSECGECVDPLISNTSPPTSD